MDNLAFIEKLLELYTQEIQDSSKLLISFGVIIIINLLVTGINIYSQFVLKNKEKLIHSFKLKEVKRIEISEEMFKKLDTLSYYDGRNNNNQFLADIQGLEKYVSSNKLFISEKLFKTTFATLDYHKTVISDYRKKDYGQEMTHISNFCKIFNK